MDGRSPIEISGESEPQRDSLTMTRTDSHCAAQVVGRERRSMPEKNRRWLLAKRPTGIVGREHFEWREEPVPSIGEGEFLIRNRWLSCDPAQRTWMEIDTYIPMLPLGEVMAAASAGVVVESKHPDFEVGQLVSGGFGWQDYAVSDGSAFGGLVPPLKIPPGVDPTTALSLFGHTGLTAYFGLLDVGEPKAGETVVVSAAAGAVGSTVCQIAKIKGCRVVGIAGGARKCGWVREELGTDDAIDYKTEDLTTRLGEMCPDGIDVFFDNVGGAVLDAALANLAVGADRTLWGRLRLQRIRATNSDQKPLQPHPPTRRYARLLGL
jgi:NADPH-dependent curcumin reductase CurA